MGIQKSEKSAFGPALILGILLIDVGLLIWGWHLYQRRQERLDDAGLNFARAPEADAEKTFVRVTPEAPSGIDRYVKKESLAVVRTPGVPTTASPADAGRPAQRAPLPPSPAPQTADSKLTSSKAVNYFFDLKNQPRFKNSKAIQAWKQDFLSHPDLKALNDGWRKDHDPLKFLVGMVKSPNFRAMAEKHLAHQDMQDFVKQMASAPAVLASAGNFMSDDSIKGAVTGLKLAPSAAPMKTSSQALR